MDDKIHSTAHNIAVSVIVPVYNGQRFLTDCIDSLLSQTLSNIEIIIVNDGSTDRSAEILQQYLDNRLSTFPIIKVIHQENFGRILARQSGIAVAQGEFFGFVDCDDWVDNTMYFDMYSAATENTADIVSCGFTNVDEHNTIKSVQIFENTFEKERAYKILAGNPPSFCNSIFKSELFNYSDINIMNVFRGEDLSIVPCLFYYAHHTIMLQKSYYYYRNLISSNKDSDATYLFSSSIPINLYKDLEGIKELFKVSVVLADFFDGKNCLASDLMPYTTKFPDFFNRYNYKYVKKYFTIHNLWKWYFSKLLGLLIQYPQYYQAHLWYAKQENKIVLDCFRRVFGRFLKKDEILSADKIFEIFEHSKIIETLIRIFRFRLSIGLFFDFFPRLKNKILVVFRRHSQK